MIGVETRYFSKAKILIVYVWKLSELGSDTNFVTTQLSNKINNIC